MAKTQKTTKGLRPPKHHGRAHHAKVYWPYIPLILLLIGAAFINIWQPLQTNRPATLAYATEMSRSGLLSATNSHRADNGAAALTLNSKLNAAAQAKANDMVARDYWSHNTPDGDEPWIFVDAQGYSYLKAGENLAYGFDTSSATVVGWMNSTMGHRENMLDTSFTEVGFGFKNGSNFNSTGPETVVVAFYGKPAVKSASSTPAPASEPEPEPKPAPSTQAAETQKPEPEPEKTTEKKEESKEVEVVEEEKPAERQPVTTDIVVPANAQSERITLLQQLTNGNTPWIALAASLFGLALAVVWLFKHYVLVRRFIIEGEHFVAHHPILDLIVVGIIAALVYLSQSAGVVL